jgi:hypothetical protein
MVAIAQLNLAGFVFEHDPAARRRAATSLGVTLRDLNRPGVRSRTVTFSGEFTTTARTNVEEQGSIDASCPEEAG